VAELIYPIYAILEKSLLLLGLIYMVWIIWMVPNDRRRARNTAILTLMLALIFFSWLFFQQRKIAGAELSGFHYIINEKTWAVERLTVLTDSLAKRLADLQTKHVRVAAEKQILDMILNDEALSESQRSRQYSDQYTKILAMLDGLEASANLYRSNLDSTVVQCVTTTFFSDRTTPTLYSILDRLEKHGHFDLISTANDAKALRLVHAQIAQRADDLIRHLKQMQSIVSDMDAQITSTRREMLKNVKIVYVGKRRSS
jgi:hypothetical protein